MTGLVIGLVPAALLVRCSIATVGGMPKIRTAMIEGPYNVTGVSASPSRDRIFVCHRPARIAFGLAWLKPFCSLKRS